MGVDDVLALVVERVTAVLGVDPLVVTAEARFDEDLHADSLDLVEVMAGVEQELRNRGLVIAISEAELVTLRTVGEAAQRLSARAAGPGLRPGAAPVAGSDPSGVRPGPVPAPHGPGSTTDHGRVR